LSHISFRQSLYTTVFLPFFWEQTIILFSAELLYLDTFLLCTLQPYPLSFYHDFLFVFLLYALNRSLQIYFYTLLLPFILIQENFLLYQVSFLFFYLPQLPSPFIILPLILHYNFIPCTHYFSFLSYYPWPQLFFSLNYPSNYLPLISYLLSYFLIFLPFVLHHNFLFALLGVTIFPIVLRHNFLMHFITQLSCSL
jgi:hypothetical protein